MIPASVRKQLKGWLSLLRLPNLLTVPGDPLAGFLLAAAVSHTVEKDAVTPWPALIVPVAIVLCLYSAGLILNDVADIEEDTVKRPWRPIPSDAVSLTSAVLAGVVLSTLAIVLASLCSLGVLISSTCLLLLVIAYTFLTRRIPLAGFISMGLCRGFSLLIGGIAALRDFQSLTTLWIAFFMLLLYILAVSSIAYYETEQCHVGIKRWFPGVVGVTGLLTLTTYLPGIYLAFPLILLFTCSTLRNGFRLAGQPLPENVGPTIGLYIRDLILLQSALCLLSSSLVTGLIIACFWPANAWLNKYFHAS